MKKIMKKMDLLKDLTLARLGVNLTSPSVVFPKIQGKVEVWVLKTFLSF